MNKWLHIIMMGEPATAKTQIMSPREDYGVMYDDKTKNAFSKQKLKYGTFQSNPTLNKFPKTGKIKMKNGSVIYFASDSGKYKHVKGKSICLIPDEKVQILVDSALASVQIAKLSLNKNSYSQALLRIKRAIKYVDETNRILKND
ncbi:MAG: hypothetical protein ACRENZ_07695 [Thermodesulfobacteriota bacterium]